MSDAVSSTEIDGFLSEARSEILKAWKDKGQIVIDECSRVNRFNGNIKDFLEYCTPCGGNWAGWFLSGISKLYPSVYNAIPDDLGLNGFFTIMYTMMLLGVRTWE